MWRSGGRRGSITTEVKLVTTALILKANMKDVPKTHDPELECTTVHDFGDVILVRQRAAALLLYIIVTQCYVLYYQY